MSEKGYPSSYVFTSLLGTESEMEWSSYTHKTLSFRWIFLLKDFLVTHNYIITFDYHLIFYKIHTNIQNNLLPDRTIYLLSFSE